MVIPGQYSELDTLPLSLLHTLAKMNGPYTFYLIPVHVTAANFLDEVDVDVEQARRN